MHRANWDQEKYKLPPPPSLTLLRHREKEIGKKRSNSVLIIELVVVYFRNCKYALLFLGMPWTRISICSNVVADEYFLVNEPFCSLSLPRMPRKYTSEVPAQFGLFPGTSPAPCVRCTRRQETSNSFHKHDPLLTFYFALPNRITTPETKEKKKKTDKKKKAKSIKTTIDTKTVAIRF